MSRFGIGPCLIVSFFASLSTLRISPSVSEVPARRRRRRDARRQASARPRPGRKDMSFSSSQLLFRNDLDPAHHPGLEMARDQAAVVELARLRELPDDLFRLARARRAPCTARRAPCRDASSSARRAPSAPASCRAPSRASSCRSSCTTKRTVSPCLTSSASGVKRILSLMSMRTVRVAFFGSPVRPKSVSTIGWSVRAGPCACVAVGEAASGASSSASARTGAIGNGQAAISGAHGCRLASPSAPSDRRPASPRARAAAALAGPLVGDGARRVLVPARILVVVRARGPRAP